MSEPLETTASLVERMEQAGEWPEPELLRAIAARGEDAVEPLLRILRQEPHGWPEEAPLYHALLLLCEIRSRNPAVMETLLAMFSCYDGESLEDLPTLLAPFGAAVAEALLPQLSQAQLPWYAYSVATQSALAATAQDPELHERVFATLVELLTELIERHQSLNENEYMIASSIVVDLAYRADPRYRDLLRRALEADVSEMMGQEDIEDYYRNGPRAQTRDQGLSHPIRRNVSVPPGAGTPPDRTEASGPSAAGEQTGIASCSDPASDTDPDRTHDWPERPLLLRQRQEIQELPPADRSEITRRWKGVCPAQTRIRIVAGLLVLGISFHVVTLSARKILM